MYSFPDPNNRNKVTKPLEYQRLLKFLTPILKDMKKVQIPNWFYKFQMRKMCKDAITSISVHLNLVCSGYWCNKEGIYFKLVTKLFILYVCEGPHFSSATFTKLKTSEHLYDFWRGE